MYPHVCTLIVCSHALRYVILVSPLTPGWCFLVTTSDIITRFHYSCLSFSNQRFLNVALLETQTKLGWNFPESERVWKPTDFLLHSGWPQMIYRTRKWAKPSNALKQWSQPNLAVQNFGAGVNLHVKARNSTREQQSSGGVFFAL